MSKNTCICIDAISFIDIDTFSIELLNQGEINGLYVCICNLSIDMPNYKTDYLIELINTYRNA